MNLLDAWGAWEPIGPPYLLNDDGPFLTSRRSSDALVSRASWEEAYRSQDFADPDDRRLHVGLLPLPYFGDLRRASVYVLLLNPGLSPTDYYGEYKVRAYRDALLAVHRQKFSDATFRFMHLDPQFAWQGGFDYWHGVFAGVIGDVANCCGMPFAMARRLLADAAGLYPAAPVPQHEVAKGARWMAPETALGGPGPGLRG